MEEGPPTARRRARSLGLRLGTMPTGPLNAITDVAGVRVGQITLFSGTGATAVRTGVTAILPHGGNLSVERVRAAVRAVNAFGKMTGTTQVAELGEMESPIVLTNTLQVGTAWNAVVTHALRANPELRTVNPVVGECNDGWLNDIRGRHVREEHVLRAIEEATEGPVAEGVVGAGTGMLLYGGWKGGIGTASRRLPDDEGGYTAGVLVLANFGGADELTIDGVHVGRWVKPEDGKRLGTPSAGGGSCIVVVATDAPVSSRQLGRMAQRVQSGLARTGTISSHASGEYALAFSTANRISASRRAIIRSVEEVVEDGTPLMDSLFQATVEGTEEAVINALFTAVTVEGRDGHTAWGFPVTRVLSSLRGD